MRAAIVLTCLLASPCLAVDVDGAEQAPAAAPAPFVGEPEDEPEAAEGYRYLPSSPLLRQAQLRRRATPQKASVAAGVAPAEAAQAPAGAQAPASTGDASAGRSGPWALLAVLGLGVWILRELWQRAAYL